MKSYTFKQKYMAKYSYFDEEILELLDLEKNNTKIAKLIFTDGNPNEIDRLRKHIAIIREYGVPKTSIVEIKEKVKKNLIEPFLNGNPDNILVIGDLHAPFTLPKYLAFCREQQEIYNCGTIIFIGDIIDNHFSSFHETDPDGYGAGEELDRAVDMIGNYNYTFPKATVIIGNHDRLVYRKAFSSGVSKQWIREYKDVLKTPDWDFVENIIINNVNYNHGEGGTARNRIKSELQSQVQGHLHTQLYTDYLVGANFIVWGMQVGCGVNNKSYAMAYGRHYKKPAIGCGVILNRGTLPIAIPMKL